EEDGLRERVSGGAGDERSFDGFTMLHSQEGSGRSTSGQPRLLSRLPEGAWEAMGAVGRAMSDRDRWPRSAREAGGELLDAAGRDLGHHVQLQMELLPGRRTAQVRDRAQRDEGDAERLGDAGARGRL